MRNYNRYYVTDMRTGERKVVDSTSDIDDIERWYPNCKVKAARTNQKESEDVQQDDAQIQGIAVDNPHPTADDLGF